MKIKNLLLFAIFYFLFSALTGCGIDSQFKSAEKLIEKGKFSEAIQKYEKIIKKIIKKMQKINPNTIAVTIYDNNSVKKFKDFLSKFLI